MNELREMSNIKIVKQLALKYYGHDMVYPSSRKYKKYMIYDPANKTWTHFGDIRYKDYTKHQDDERRENYIRRAIKIKGDWYENPYSPNFLSLVLLWDYYRD